MTNKYFHVEVWHDKQKLSDLTQFTILAKYEPEVRQQLVEWEGLSEKEKNNET